MIPPFEEVAMTVSVSVIKMSEGIVCEEGSVCACLLYVETVQLVLRKANLSQRIRRSYLLAKGLMENRKWTCLFGEILNDKNIEYT